MRIHDRSISDTLDFNWLPNRTKPAKSSEYESIEEALRRIKKPTFFGGMSASQIEEHMRNARQKIDAKKLEKED